MTTRDESGAAARHAPGLDALRGLAISSVVLHHSFWDLRPDQLSAMPPWFQWAAGVLQFGYLGVHLFFTLSGFLITGILLDTRERADYYRHFYLRRLVRIGPAYVMTLAALLALGMISAKYALLCLLFLSNVPGLMGLRAEYGVLWSLAVEEQFYLFWPFVVRHLSVRRLVMLSALIVILSPLLRWALQFGPPSLADIRFKLWAVADFFAVGALAAVAVRSGVDIRKLGLFALVLGLAGVYWQFSADTWGSPLDKALHLTPFTALFAGMLLLSYAFDHFALTWVGQALCFLGKISYGLYLIHQMVFELMSRYLRQVQFDDVQTAVTVQMTAEIAAAVLLAFVSRSTVEAWFMSKVPRSRAA